MKLNTLVLLFIFHSTYSALVFLNVRVNMLSWISQIFFFEKLSRTVLHNK